MPEFKFYLSPQEHDKVLRSIVNLGRLSFFGSRNYRSQIPQTLYTLEEIYANYPPNRSFHIGGPFSAAPPFTHRVGGDGPYADTYVIEEARGGPLLTFSMPPILERDGIILLSGGSLSHLDVYWDDNITRGYWPPQELKDWYKKIKAAIQQHLLRATVAGYTKWVGKEAWALYKQNKAAIQEIGKYWRVTDERPKANKGKTE